MHSFRRHTIRYCMSYRAVVKVVGIWGKREDVEGHKEDVFKSSKSAILLDGERSEAFDVEQGVAQGCSLSAILFSVFINWLLREVEEAEIGIVLSSGGRLGGLLFADELVGVSESKDQSQ